MNIFLNDQNQKLTGSETIKYHNNSPDQLEYLWIQLDQNKKLKTQIVTKFKLVILNL